MFFHQSLLILASSLFVFIFSIVKIVIAFMVVVRGEKMAAQLIPRE
jgi:hypothetical protein